MPMHVVCQGETLTIIALESGIPAKDIWEHDKNTDLRTARPDPDVLAPGDVIFIPEDKRPELSFSPGTANKYKAELPAVQLNMKVAAHAGEAFVIRTPSGKAIEGTVGEDGSLQAAIGPLARHVRLSFPQSAVEWEVAVGHLDPATLPSGARARLMNLGYMLSIEELFGIEVAEAMDATTRPLSDAIEAFQCDQGLPETGVLDQATADALVKQHGS